jgi:hypothetical protein
VWRTSGCLELYGIQVTVGARVPFNVCLFKSLLEERQLL